MPLTPGSRLGAYEILASLGAGGMGEVYRARDTRLDRVVAVKVVTGALSGDADARLRFEQEARAIAALNHPHICTIHDVGRHDEVDYLVMEYLEGETLGDRLKKTGALAIPDALAIAAQIADALDRAHRIGIVHRDLKPGNVMLLRAAGQGTPVAKLMDFGLAMQAPMAGPAGQSSLSATLAPSMMATRPPSATMGSGFSGTVQYMAPEQMEGLPVDHRSDVFAFGCVLYEMLAGRKAFEGASAAAAIASVMTGDPPPVPALQSAPPVIDHLLRRCLDKDRDRRWQSMGDVAGELRWIASQPLAIATAPPAAPGRRSSTWALVAGGAAVLAMGAALIWGFGLTRTRVASSPGPALTFEIETGPTDDPSMALSPDGKLLVFVANVNRRPALWLRPLDKLETQMLPGTEGASFPFWSPDGHTIGFFANDKLKRIEVKGGTPIEIADAPNARGGAWGDGVILFAPGVSTSLSRVSTSGGPVQRVTQTGPTTGPAHRWPQFLPDGKRFLFHSSLGNPDTNGIYVGSLEGPPPVRVIESETAGRFVPPDQFLTVRRGALVAYRFNATAGKVEGEPVVVAQGFSASGPGASAFSTSGAGLLTYRPGVTQQRQLMWVNRQGLAPVPIGEPHGDSVGSPELSPDEKALAVFLQPKGDNEVGVVDLQRNLQRLITNGPPADAHPVWDPDGRHVVYSSTRLGAGVGPIRQSVDGTDSASPLFSKPVAGVVLSWTHDRQFVLLRREGTKESADLVAISIDGSRTVPVADSAYEEIEGQFSPDGKWVAFVSNETGHNEVIVQSFPERDRRAQVSTSGGSQVRWAQDGREIFYLAPDGKMMAVALTIGSAGRPQPAAPVALFQTYLATGTNVIGNKAQYAVARDGRFLLNALVETPSKPIVVVTDWTRALAR